MVSMQDGIDLGIDGIDDGVELGHDGFGSVFRAHQPEPGRTVAVRILPIRPEPSLRDRYRRECGLIKAVSQHPNIVTLYTAGFTHLDQPCLIMEYVPNGSLTDRMVMIVCTVGLSISILVYIIVFQYVLAYKLGWFPVQGWGNSFEENLVKYASLPILIGLVVGIAPNLRLYRTFVLDEINQDYVRTARAKGVGENRIMWVHVLRNASIPIITHVMAALPGLLIGAFLIERFFSIPGIGREVILAVERSDFPVIKALTVYVAIATMVANLMADLMYKAVDPRVQLK